MKEKEEEKRVAEEEKARKKEEQERKKEERKRKKLLKEKEKEEKRKERERKRLLKDQEKKKSRRVKKQDDKFCENVSDEDVESNDEDEVECPVCHLGGLSCQWICCDNCDIWYHTHCTDVNPKRLPDTFYCPSCK